MKTSHALGLVSANIIAYDSSIYDILNLITVTDISENLFTPGIRGNIVIHDKNGFMALLPFIGEEQLVLSYMNASGTVTAFTGNIISIENVVIDEDVPSTRKYNVFFTSMTAEKNINTKSSISNTTDTSDIIVTNLFATHLGIPINVEKSVTVFNLSTPYWNPFRIVQLISLASYNEDGYGDYILYENKWGWHWKTLRSLISADVKYVYTYLLNAAESSVKSFDPFIIRHLRYNYIFNTIKGAKQGLYGSSTISYSAINKNVNYLASVRDWDKIDAAPKMGESVRGYSRGKADEHEGLEDINPGNTLKGKSYTNLSSPLASMHIKANEPDSAIYTIEHDKGLLSRQLQAAINQYSATITVDGNSELSVGDMINVVIPSLSQKKDIDKINAGKHLITGITHVITNNNFLSQLTIVNDAFDTPLEKRDIIDVTKQGK